MSVFNGFILIRSNKLGKIILNTENINQDVNQIMATKQDIRIVQRLYDKLEVNETKKKKSAFELISVLHRLPLTPRYQNITTLEKPVYCSQHDLDELNKILEYMKTYNEQNPDQNTVPENQYPPVENWLREDGSWKSYDTVWKEELEPLDIFLDMERFVEDVPDDEDDEKNVVRFYSESLQKSATIEIGLNKDMILQELHENFPNTFTKTTFNLTDFENGKVWFDWIESFACVYIVTDVELIGITKTDVQTVLEKTHGNGVLDQNEISIYRSKFKKKTDKWRHWKKVQNVQHYINMIVKTTHENPVGIVIWRNISEHPVKIIPLRKGKDGTNLNPSSWVSNDTIYHEVVCNLMILYFESILYKGRSKTILKYKTVEDDDKKLQLTNTFSKDVLDDDIKKKALKNLIDSSVSMNALERST